MGILGGVLNQVRNTATAGLNRAADAVKTAVTNTAEKLKSAAETFAKPLSSPVPIPQVFQNAVDTVKNFAQKMIPTFGKSPAPALTDTASRFQGPVRDANAIAKSGALQEFAKLRGVEVPKSELNRSLDHDAVLVRQDLSKMTPQQIGDLKTKAYANPELPADLAAAKKTGHYGSDMHKQYGATVAHLTGGVISAEEAMAMNPTGGLPGPGAKEIPFLRDIDPVARHAMRHDATGFLLTKFNVGPGYGSPTTPLSFAKDNPLAGQVLGVLRESVNATKLPSIDNIGPPVR